MKNKKIVFYGFMGAILISVGAADAAQIASKDYVDNANTAMTTYVDTGLGAKANTADLGTLSAKDTVGTIDIDDASVTKPKLSAAVQATLDKADAAVQSADLTGYATTAALDAKADQVTTYTKTEVDTALVGKADTATTLAGYGITDAATAAELAAKADTATTLAGYGITDAMTTTAITTALGAKADQVTTYTKTEVDTALVGKADTATTLAGYGITDAATAAELAAKADAATTLAGYGITDAMTTTAITTALGDKADVSALTGKEDTTNKSDNIATDTGSTTKYTTVNAVEVYSVPKPTANCLGAQAQCVLAINKTDGSIYWEDVAMP